MSVGDRGSPESLFVDPAGKRGIRFPEVRGRSLLGFEFALPRELPGELTLVVVAFERREGPRRVVVLANLGGTDESTVVPGTGRLRDLWSGSDYAAGRPIALGPYGFRILEASRRSTAGVRR